ncbi:hypothetical protein R4Y45_01540 [Holzapfeliella sp. He02]|uniref:Integral membrane protein n=1 Tax=Holzapfeliella saturejae TaxID=3082953 RepID=A0ABU8SGV8_9LACO
MLFVLQSLVSFAGITVLSLGAAILRLGSVGLDPFTAINTALSSKFHIDLGIFQLGFNFIIFVFIVLLDRKKIGFGTIMNMVLVGFEIQFFYESFSNFFILTSTLVSIGSAVIGLLLFTLGSSLYMGPGLGVAPYDAVAPILSKRLHIKYKIARIIQDLIFMVSAYVLGGPVGFATIIIAFFAGPLITMWNKRVSYPLVRNVEEFAAEPTPKSLGTRLVAATKVGYEAVRKSYEETFEIQKEMTGFSDEELQERIKVAKQNYQDAERVAQNSQRQYEMLEKERENRND